MKPACFRSRCGLRAGLALLTSFAAICIGAATSVAAGPGEISQWMWATEFPKPNQDAYFRLSFEVGAKLRRAELQGLADDRMSVYLNGGKAADIEERQRLSSTDVTASIQQGLNVIAVHGHNKRGHAGALIKLRLTFADGTQRDVISDDTWRASLNHQDGWELAAFPASGWGQAVSLGQLGVFPWGAPVGEVDDYNQWKQALGSVAASDPAQLAVASGFQVELLRSAAEGEGSWISMAFDPKGRLTLSREDKGLLRLTLPKTAGDRIAVETIDQTLPECRGLLYAFGSLYANANNAKALYRLRDSNGDDRFDDIKLLKQTDGGVGHGRNDLVLGLDNMIYVVHGNNVKLPDDYSRAGSPLANIAEDQLRPCTWDRFLFDGGVKVPAGHVIRTDSEGSKWELVAGGFRNAYGLDFNADGEMFTYDADNEGDIGAPWYRPTRVNHVVSGGDYGFRQGTANRPGHYPENSPVNLDVGLGSPTSVKFGTHSHFPPRYRKALFILDWAYGRIFAVHLTQRGASYACRAEKFIEGRPLNVTDIEFGPDGAMYFITGGRRTQSGLYRVSYIGPPVADPPVSAAELAADRQTAGARALRRSLEAFHTVSDPQAVTVAWPHLESSDPWIRQAARIAVERQPVESWQARALAESKPMGGLTALLALARVGGKDLQARLVARLDAFSLSELSPDQQIMLLRVYAVCCIRMGRPAPALAEQIVARLAPAYPSEYEVINQRLCDLLAFLDAPGLVSKTIPLLSAAETQEEQLFYLFALRNVKSGWSLEDRKTYFAALRKGSQFRGGNMLPIAINSIRDESLGWLTDAERVQLAPLLTEDQPAAGSTALAKRTLVKEWKMDDLADGLEAVGSGRDYERGKSLYAAALCNRCHRLGMEGAPVGPDLTAVGGRFNRRDLLETIVNPSKVVDEKYRNVQIETTQGLAVVGRVVGGDDQTLVISTDPLVPSQIKRVARSDIETQQTSLISPMPAGLLNTLTKDEILDLLAYVQAGGDPRHPNFKR